jgi:hypothetical protein
MHPLFSAGHRRFTNRINLTHPVTPPVRSFPVDRPFPPALLAAQSVQAVTMSRPHPGRFGVAALHARLT